MTYVSVPVDHKTRHYKSEERNINKLHPENLGFTTLLSHDTDMYAHVEYINLHENRYERCATERSFRLNILHFNSLRCSLLEIQTPRSFIYVGPDKRVLTGKIFASSIRNGKSKE